MFLDFPPVFSEEAKALNEFQMLILSPSALKLDSIKDGVNALLGIFFHLSFAFVSQVFVYLYYIFFARKRLWIFNLDLSAVFFFRLRVEGQLRFLFLWALHLKLSLSLLLLFPLTSKSHDFDNLIWVTFQFLLFSLCFDRLSKFKSFCSLNVLNGRWFQRHNIGLVFLERKSLVRGGVKFVRLLRSERSFKFRRK